MDKEPSHALEVITGLCGQEMQDPHFLELALERVGHRSGGHLPWCRGSPAQTEQDRSPHKRARLLRSEGLTSGLLESVDITRVNVFQI